MTMPEAIFYSICAIVGGSLIAWAWYLAAKSEPYDPYEKYLPKRDWSVTYKYDDKENGE